MFLILMEYVAFPERKDSIFAKTELSEIGVTASGSMGLYYEGKCHQTFPNETLSADKKMDWCSNIAKSDEDKPWISYNLKDKAMKIKGFSVRNGCCWYGCCCVDDNTRITDVECCCVLVGFSLQGSNDNSTWKVIHKVDEVNNFYPCTFRTYEFAETEPFRYIRFVQERQVKGCQFCMQLNQLELYGSTIHSSYSNEDIDENDESVSIIGKIRASNE